MIKGRSKRLGNIHEYFFSRKNREIQDLREKGVDVINLGIGSPDLPPHPSVIEALGDSSRQEGNHGYQPYNGTLELRNAISEWMNLHFGVKTRAESDILPLIGSKEGILHISMAFLDEGDTVAIPEIGYPTYRSVSNMLGARIVEYPLTHDWQPDWDNMPGEVKNARIFWLNYPHMPSGAAPAEGTFRKAVNWGKQTQTLICHDNPYVHILNEKPQSILSEPGSEEVCLELHSLSKSHNMAGWRLGWVAGHRGYIRDILRVKSNIDSGMFRGIQDAAIQALELGDQWFRELNKIYRERQEIAFELLKALGCEFNYPQSGLFVWGKIPEGNYAEELSARILTEHGIFVAPGHIFGDKGKQYIRISLCQNAGRMKEALKRLS